MRFKKRRSKLKWPVAGIGPVDWDEIEEQGLPGQSYEEFLKTVPKLKAIDEQYEQDCDDYCDYYDDY